MRNITMETNYLIIALVKKELLAAAFAVATSAELRQFSLQVG
jgi:hypothetical protein